MSGLRLRRAPALAWTVSAALALASLVLLVLGPGRPLRGDVFGGLGGVSFLVLSLAYTTVGAIVASRVPENPIGWIFWITGLAVGVGVLAWAYADYGLFAAGQRLPGATTAAWLPSEPFAGLLGVTLVLFPDGRLPSRRWLPAAGTLVLAMALLLVTNLLRPGPIDEPFASVSSPLGVPGWRGAMDALNTVGWILVVLGIALAAASTLVRLRRARGLERQQLKLVLAVGAVAAAATALAMGSWLLWPEGGLQIRMGVMGLSFAAFPVAAGVAILRHRLYDIDVVINRTLVYGALTVLLAAAYAATTLLLGTALGQGSAWATAGATLVVALAFLPLRARLQDAVDRRFNRARYDALRRMERFLEELRAGRAAPEEVEGVLRELVADPGVELRFFLPETQLYVDTRGRAATDSAAEERERVPIERAGQPLAVVLHDPAREADPTLLPELVRAGGLALEIARLRVELRRQLAEVEASRARIVAAGDAERRRIERDLHDGAQQRLVSIGLALRHAQHQLGPGADHPARATIDGAVAELAVAIEELRELARGLPPAELDAGLEPALRELAGRAPLPVEVRARVARLSTAVEGAAYFIACEGLTNAVKHARASRVVLSAAQENGTLVVSIADDGFGGARAADGSGLSGLSDRVVAQGGTLTVQSDPGTGTTLTAELPCAS